MDQQQNWNKKIGDAFLALAENENVESPTQSIVELAVSLQTP